MLPKLPTLSRMVRSEGSTTTYANMQATPPNAPEAHRAQSHDKRGVASRGLAPSSVPVPVMLAQCLLLIPEVLRFQEAHCLLHDPVA